MSKLLQTALDAFIIAVTGLIALPAIIMLLVNLHAAVTIYRSQPMPEEWQAVAACESLAGARLWRAEVTNYPEHPRWWYVEDGRYHCRLYWWHTGEWTGSVMSERARVEVVEREVDSD